MSEHASIAGTPELTDAPKPKYIEGTWPEHCEQRAFVAGAKWWEFASTGGTMWPSDRDKAEAEAVRRYGEPVAIPASSDVLTEPAEAKLCPFCGNAPIIEERGTGGWAVACEADACLVLPDTGSLRNTNLLDAPPVPLTRAEAISMWNRRAPESAPEASNG